MDHRLLESARSPIIYAFIIVVPIYYFPQEQGILYTTYIGIRINIRKVGLGGLGIMCSRSKVRGFKSGRGRWIFSGRKNPEHKSSGRDFKLGVPRLRFQAR